MAESYVRSLVDTHRRSRTLRLPSVKAMAAAAHVSHITILKVVAALTREGIVTSAPSRGVSIAIHPASANSPPSEPAARDPIKSAVRDEILADLRGGGYTFGQPLPSLKQCSSRYGCSVGTLRKALAALCATGILRHRGRRYLVPGGSQTNRGDTLVLFARSNAEGILQYLVPRQELYLPIVERECAALGMQLHISGVHHSEHGFATTPRSGGIGPTVHWSGAVAGYLILASGVDHEFIARTTRQLLPSGKPIAILDEATGVPEVPLSQQNQVRIWQILADAEPAWDLGRYLGQRGHRRVAYFSVEQGTGWSEGRLRGLEAGLRSVFAGAEVVPFFMSPESWAEMARVREGVARESGLFAQRIGRLMGERLADGFEGQMEDSVFGPAMTGYFEMAMRETFAHAASDRSLTAWVGANDQTAVPCVRFLRSSGIRVPAEVAVAGFDNSILSSHYGLTSYHFGGDAAIHQMLEFIVRSLSVLLEERRGAIVVKGRVQVRETA